MDGRHQTKPGNGAVASAARTAGTIAVDVLFGVMLSFLCGAFYWLAVMALTGGLRRPSMIAALVAGTIVYATYARFHGLTIAAGRSNQGTQNGAHARESEDLGEPPGSFGNELGNTGIYLQDWPSVQPGNTHTPKHGRTET